MQKKAIALAIASMLSGAAFAVEVIYDSNQDTVIYTDNDSTGDNGFAVYGSGSLMLQSNTSTGTTINYGATVNGNLTTNGDIVNDDDVFIRVDNDAAGYGNFVVVDQNGGTPVTTLLSNAQGTSIATDGAGSLVVGNNQTSLGVTNAGGSLNGITSNATETVVSGGTGTTTVTVNNGGVTVVDSGFGQTFQVSNTGTVQVGGNGSTGPAGVIEIGNGLTDTITLIGATGSINAAGTITGGIVNATSGSIATLSSTNE